MDKVLNERDFLDALNNYYKFKSNYDDSFQKEKTNIINNESLSWKEKRGEFKNYKPKCINCKRPVGTIFSRTYDEKEFSRVLKAVCGDIQDPCSLNITLNIGFYEHIPNIIKTDEKDIENFKISVIKDKNNLLFDYITTEAALDNFEKFKIEIIEISTSLEAIKEIYMNIYDNEERKKNLQKLQEESYILTDTIKKLINDFSHNNNNTLVHDAVTIYVKQLIPKLKQLAKVKYEVNKVEFFEDENIYRLIQYENSIQSLEYNYGKPEIIHYDIGISYKPTNNKRYEEEEKMRE
jgi:hypothetical protein